MFRILSAHGLFSLARAFIGAVLVIYLLDRGISLSVIAIAKSAQLVVSVLFNYPAGLISDKYGNKVAILLACVAEIVYFALMIHPSDNQVILGEMFNGLGIAFYTGAYEAWVFTHKKKTEDSFSLISRSAEMLFIATIISGVIGAIFSQHSLLLSIVFMAISICVYAITPESRRCASNKDNKLTEYRGVIKLFKAADANVVSYMVIGGFMQLIYQFWPVFFKSEPLAFTQKEVGFVFASSMIAQWMFTIYARKIGFNNQKYATMLCYSGIIITSITTILGAHIFNETPLLITLSYCMFISFCSLTTNYLFSKSCNLFSNSHDESSMISLLDTGARCLGALSLAVISALNIQNISVIWCAFPVFVVVVSFVHILKKVLSYEF